jgi:hypothetical protein
MHQSREQPLRNGLAPFTSQRTPAPPTVEWQYRTMKWVSGTRHSTTSRDIRPSSERPQQPSDPLPRIGSSRTGQVAEWPLRAHTSGRVVRADRPPGRSGTIGTRSRPGRSSESKSSNIYTCILPERKCSAQWARTGNLARLRKLGLPAPGAARSRSGASGAGRCGSGMGEGRTEANGFLIYIIRRRKHRFGIWKS